MGTIDDEPQGENWNSISSLVHLDGLFHYFSVAQALDIQNNSVVPWLKSAVKIWVALHYMDDYQ